MGSVPVWDKVHLGVGSESRLLGQADDSLRRGGMTGGTLLENC